MLAADGLEDPLSDEISAEIGQGPAAMGQAQFIGSLVSDPKDRGPLVGRQAGRGATPPDLGDDAEPASIEGVQDRIDGVGMEREVVGDPDGVPALAVQEEDFGSAPLEGGRVVAFEVPNEATKLTRVWFASTQRAGHSGTSERER